MSKVVARNPQEQESTSQVKGAEPARLDQDYRLPKLPNSDIVSEHVKPSMGAAVDQKKNLAALEELGIDSESHAKQYRVTDTYGRYSDEFIRMTAALFPRLSVPAETRETVLALARERNIQNIDRELAAGVEKDAPYTRAQLELAKRYMECENQWLDFLGDWYDSDTNAVRAQLFEQLTDRSPEFSMPFVSREDLEFSAGLLGGEIAPIEFRAELPKTISDFGRNIQGQGGLDTTDQPPYRHRIVVGAVSPETIRQIDEFKEIAEQLDTLTAPGSLGQVLVHEEIHVRTGEPFDTPEGDIFHTAELAMEIPTVLYDLLMVTHAYHEWRKKTDPNYNYRNNPTDIVLKTAHGTLPIDAMYEQAKNRFGIFEEDGVDKYLELLDKPETQQFLNRLIWGTARPPKLD